MSHILLVGLNLKISNVIGSHLIFEIEQGAFDLFSLSTLPMFYCIQIFTYLLTPQLFFQTIFLNYKFLTLS